MKTVRLCAVTKNPRLRPSLRGRGGSLVAFGVAVLAGWSTLALAAPGDVKLTLAAPCRYPAGLAVDGTHLFVLDWREAKIYEITPADGKIVTSFAAPTLRPYGLTYADGKLYVSDDHTGWVYALNLQTGLVDNSFEAPGPRPTGLAYADQALFILERQTGQIYKVMPEDGTILAYFPAPNDTCRRYYVRYRGR